MASRDTDPVSLEKRKQKLRDLMAEEKQKHELKMKGWSDKLRELDTLGKYHGPQANGAFLPEDAEHGNGYESGSSSASASQGPPGFPGSAWDTSAHTQASSLSSLYHSQLQPMAAASFLHHNPDLQQQQHSHVKVHDCLHATFHPKSDGAPPFQTPYHRSKQISPMILGMLLPPESISSSDIFAISQPQPLVPDSVVPNKVQDVDLVLHAPAVHTTQPYSELDSDAESQPVHISAVGKDKSHLLPSPDSVLDLFPLPYSDDSFTDYTCHVTAFPASATLPQPLLISGHNPDVPALTCKHPQHTAPQNGNTPLSNGRTPRSATWSASQPQPDHSPALATVTPQGPRSVFHRLGQTPPAHQQTNTLQSLQSQTSPHAALNGFDHPPGFAGPKSLTAQPISQDCEIPSDFVMPATSTAQDLPPGFPTPGSSSAQQPSRRSGMRSDQAPYSARSQDSGYRSANQDSPSPGQPPPNSGAPPGFAGLPAYLAQRLSPAPAQQPAGLAHQAPGTSPRTAPGSPSTAGIDTSGPAVTQDGSSDEAPPGFARAGSSSLPSRPSGELRDRGSTAGHQSSSASAREEGPPGYGAQPARQLPADGWGGSGSRNGGQPSTSREDRHGGEEEFPGLAFGIKGLDQQQKFSSADSSQDFPSLGAPAGADGGSKPAGAWGKGPGQLAGSLRQQQQQHQVSSVAASLAAAVRPPQPSALHVERVELSDGLRVRGDDASDSVRKKRARKHEFEKWERVKGMGSVNIVEGLELHENVLSPEEQANMIAIIEQWVVQGKQGRLKGRTFSAPRKWARGKGRITCQFGCCYNYAIDSEGRKPGIVAEEVVEKMPPVLVSLCKRLIRWGILPKHKEPDTAIINVYDVEDCIPPHIDHHDFDRPFCTISLLSQQNIMFGSKIISRGPGDFVADYEMPLPTGSCLVLKGNGADVAQHCVPPVSARRMSITLRRMQDVHARRVVAMAERMHAGLPVDTDNPPSGPQRLTGDDAYDMEERREASYGSKRR